MIDSQTIKQAARGRWPEILRTLGGISADLLDGKHHPCPKCGGTDRFRFDSAKEFCFCNQCFSKDNGDGIAALQWLTDESFLQVSQRLAEYLHVGNGHANGAAKDGSSKGTVTYASPEDAIRDQERRLGPHTARWDYHDASGNLVGVVVRWNLDDGKKTFRPFSLDGFGWVAKGMPDPWTLYHLPELAGAQRVYICEGEKAVDAARSIGLTATTSPHGCKSADKADWSVLAGKDVVLLPDNDDPGRKYAETVAGILTHLSPPATVRIVELPDLPPAGDIVEWIDRHGDTAEPESMRAEIGSLAQAAEMMKTDAPEDSRRFKIITSDELDQAECTPRFLISDCLVANEPAVIGGMFKTLKTLIAVDMAISTASGQPFLGEWEVTEPLSTIYFCGEGGLGVLQDYARRIAGSKGLGLSDVCQLGWCTSVPQLEDLKSLDDFKRACEEREAKLAFLDCLYLMHSGDDAGNVMKQGRLLNNVKRVCDQCGITLVILHHFKRGRTTDPYAPGELIDLSQAGLAEFASQWALLTRRGPYNPDQPGEHKLWLNVGGRAGHSHLEALDVQ